jgi:pyruvate formate lyase activating enzyme
MVERWELCTFNNLCQDKYRRLGLEWTYRQTPLIAQNELDQLESWARSSNFPDERVVATGATRLEI